MINFIAHLVNSDLFGLASTCLASLLSSRIFGVDRCNGSLDKLSVYFQVLIYHIETSCINSGSNSCGRVGDGSFKIISKSSMIPPEPGDPLKSKYGIFPVLISIIQSPKAQISAATVIFPILVILSGDKYP